MILSPSYMLPALPIRLRAEHAIRKKVVPDLQQVEKASARLPFLQMRRQTEAVGGDFAVSIPTVVYAHGTDKAGRGRLPEGPVGPSFRDELTDQLEIRDRRANLVELDGGGLEAHDVAVPAGSRRPGKEPEPGDVEECGISWRRRPDHGTSPDPGEYDPGSTPGPGGCPSSFNSSPREGPARRCRGRGGG